MLTKPRHGWTDFSLEGTFSYGLSYLDDIAFTWIDQAIHGLETMLPFCVKGFLEPGRFLCTISFWNCYILVEDDGRCPISKESIGVECSHTSMIDFCKYLYQDVSGNIDEWVSFVDYDSENREEKRQKLLQTLERLKELISERERLFDGKHSFF